jgi:hypothetical protein
MPGSLLYLPSAFTTFGGRLTPPTRWVCRPLGLSRVGRSSLMTSSRGLGLHPNFSTIGTLRFGLMVGSGCDVGSSTSERTTFRLEVTSSPNSIPFDGAIANSVAGGTFRGRTPFTQDFAQQFSLAVTIRKRVGSAETLTACLNDLERGDRHCISTSAPFGEVFLRSSD